MDDSPSSHPYFLSPPLRLHCGSFVSSVDRALYRVGTFIAEKRKKHARTLRERWAPKVSKMAAISIFLFSTIYYATADIPVSSDNFPTQEDSCRYNLAVVRFSYEFLNFKRDFKAFDVPAACKQIAYTGLLLSRTFLQKVTI